MALFKGAGVALVTPMKENLQVDFDKLAELLEDQIKNETDSIIITGTTGEASTLTEDEHLEVIRAAVSIRLDKSIAVLVQLEPVPAITGIRLLTIDTAAARTDR